ncbi:hypothetical protein MBSD_n2132 [Mizugakiibacter sediminis]|uniref:Uncharacterized protein n=1 Tax=Mizugakiibacter sediminis TaxID=1475481 RepID=A0A0K8QR12_9GAMM|nr:hypothetical protein MBSD_n2132 [Mizugakiibacter sediminis]
MARIRSIKPEFPQSESMGRVSREARLLFILLWPICDDYGRTRAASRMLASTLFPYDDDAKDLIDGWLDELEREGCILRYEVNGSTYLEITNWLIHQKIDKPSKPQFPESSGSSREGSRESRECSRLLLGREGKGEDGKGEDAPPAKRGCRLPSDWQPTPGELRWATDARPDIDAKAEVERFRDYWVAQAGQKGVKLDWSATWRNWIRNARGKPGATASPDDRSPASRRKLA